jgi:hypothetical protein
MKAAREVALAVIGKIPALDTANMKQTKKENCFYI